MSVPDESKIPLLYFAVRSLEHCSIEICGGKIIPSLEAHSGSFVRALCQPSIWSRANGMSISGYLAACNAKERTSSSRCFFINSSIVLNLQLHITHYKLYFVSVFIQKAKHIVESFHTHQHQNGRYNSKQIHTSTTSQTNGSCHPHACGSS